MPKKILVADDDATLVTAISARLIQKKFKVVTAFDVLQVMNVAFSADPDLIVLDIKMPAGTGTEALENLKSSSKTFAIPVIVMTAFPTDELRRLAVEKGAVGFLEKPFKIEELLRNIEEALGMDQKS